MYVHGIVENKRFFNEKSAFGITINGVEYVGDKRFRELYFSLDMKYKNIVIVKLSKMFNYYIDDICLVGREQG